MIHRLPPIHGFIFSCHIFVAAWLSPFCVFVLDLVPPLLKLLLLLYLQLGAVSG
jgi:hypothetical protein